jgi:hypothetical protein
MLHPHQWGSEVTMTGLLKLPHLWDFAVMRFRAVIRWLLVLTIAAGVSIGPGAPVMAAMPSALDVTMMTAATGDDAMQMADEMPCCPDQTKANDCHGCPFVALCMLTLSVPAPSGTGVLIKRYPLRTAFATTDDLLIDGLGAKPPDHPPRTDV